MIDRENAIIRTIETKLALAESMEQHEIWITLDVMHEILELLKEQQQIPVKDVQWHEATRRRMVSGICPACNSIITYFNGSRFCDKCGQAVKWG